MALKTKTLQIKKNTVKKKTVIKRINKIKKQAIAHKIQKKKIIKLPEDESKKIKFLSDILDKMVATKNHYDTRSQIILGISTLIFIFSMGSILNDTQKGVIGFLIIAISSLTSSVISLYSIITPMLFQSHSTKKSLMHHGYLSQFSQAVAIKKLNEIIEDKNKIIEQYMREIYNIARNSIMIKKRFNKNASIVLIWGLVIGFILIIFLP